MDPSIASQESELAIDIEDPGVNTSEVSTIGAKSPEPIPTDTALLAQIAFDRLASMLP